MTEKNFKAILIVNYKTGLMRIIKRKNYNALLGEVTILIDITIDIPEKPIFKAKGRITLSGEKVQEMVLEELTRKE